MGIPQHIHKGMVIRQADDLLKVLEVKEARTGKQKPTVHITLRDLRSGSTFDRTLDALGDFQEATVELRSMKYLYTTGSEHVFMDNETFEQVEFADEQLEREKDFLVLDREYKVVVIDGEPLAIDLPAVVVLAVTDTAPPAHVQAGASNVQKEATLETGLQIKVPMFIKTGEQIRVDTASRQYAGKEHAS